MSVTIREMRKDEIHLMVSYFADSSAEFLRGMGADKSKITDKEEWINGLKLDFDKPVEKKEFYYLTWLFDDEPIGHSSINNIEFGKQATMHLHLWDSEKRMKGLGVDLIKQSIPVYFKKFDLEKLVCEPYSLNPAPNKVLKKLGFSFIKKYETIPGKICFRQFVNRYEITRKFVFDGGLGPL